MVAEEIKEQQSKRTYSIPFERKTLREFGYTLLFVAVLFGMTFTAINLPSFNFWYYAGAVIVVALIVFVTKRFVANLFEVKLTNKFWLTGLIISAVATLFLSSLGAPILVPFLNTSEYSRQNTLKGLKQGEVKVEEKWKISMFSSTILLAFSMFFFWLNTVYQAQPLFAAGTFLVIYPFLNLLPYQKFDGAFMFYHNIVMSCIKVLLALLTLILVLISFWAGFTMFIIFALFNIASYRLKLW